MMNREQLLDEMVQILRKHYAEHTPSWDTAVNCHCGHRSVTHYDRAFHLASAAMDAIPLSAKF